MESKNNQKVVAKSMAKMSVVIMQQMNADLGC